MQNAIAKCLCLALLTASACPAATPPEESAGRVVVFGQVLKLLSGKHPYLDLTQGSAMQSFHFTIGAAAKQEIKGSLAAFHSIFVEAHVLRDRKKTAVILRMGDLYAYYTSDGSHSFLAMAAPNNADHVLASTSGGISAGGFLTNQRAGALGMPGSDIFGVTVSGKPPIFMRVLDLIHAKMLIANKVDFRALPLPTLSLRWQPGKKEFCSLHAFFDTRNAAPFPVRRFTMKQLKGGIVSTAWISGIGEGAAPGGPVIHRIKEIEDRAGLPWKNVGVMMLFHRFIKSANYMTGTPPASAKYFKMRKRFIKWTMTPDMAMTATQADTKPATKLHSPSP